MKTKLSGLVDDELERHDEQVLFDALRRGEEGLRGCWGEYLVIGAALRRESRLDADITGRVMAALEHEPTALSPRRAASRRRSWQRPVLASAATLAGVGVVAWVALVQPGSQSVTQAPVLVQREAPATQAAAVQPVQQATAVRDMREYLAAHQTQSGFLQFRGGTENIRTVSATGRASAP